MRERLRVTVAKAGGCTGTAAVTGQLSFTGSLACHNDDCPAANAISESRAPVGPSESDLTSSGQRNNIIIKNNLSKVIRNSDGPVFNENLNLQN